VAGHVTTDHVGDEARLGGTASYASAVAAALGLSVAVITSAPGEFPIAAERSGVTVHRTDAATPTVFEHRWLGARREQYLRSRAETLSTAGLPASVLQAPIALFGPVVWEVETPFVAGFDRALRGATVQGWLRRAAADGHLEETDPRLWDCAPLLAALDAVFLSEEDLALSSNERELLLDEWAAQVRMLAVTRGSKGADLAVDGRWYSIGAFPVAEVDGTGAGDAFAAAFLIRYHEAADVDGAARFAVATASFMVEAPGTLGAPSRAQVVQRLESAPEIHLRPRSAT
jgi:1D-myo-inositol 3-kinase